MNCLGGGGQQQQQQQQQENASSSPPPRVEHKRMVHNEVERRRKVKINNWIYRLGDLLPGCSDDKKISKNGILERAVVYLKELQENNDKLLHGQCTEVQVAEFQRMKERIEELELRNSELTRVVESSGISVDLDALWQQRGKYSQKIEPENAAVLFSCKNKAASSVDKKSKPPLLPKSLDAKLTESSKNQSVANVNEGNVLSMQQNSIVKLGPAKPELKLDNPHPVTLALQVHPKPAAAYNNLECTAVSLAPNSSVTAVTQALPSVPIMSTSQHSSGSQQQLLQQLPVLNYGNTVNIFPGLSGQSQPMIIINEQGIPLLQNLLPGQMYLQHGPGQPVSLTNHGSIQQNSCNYNIPAKSASSIVAVTNDIGSGGNGTLLFSALQPSSALSTGMASSQIYVNAAGIGQPLLQPTTVSSQHATGQLVLNPTLSQSLFPNSAAPTYAGLVNGCPVSVSSHNPCIQAETLSTHSAALPATNAQAIFQPAAVAATHILPGAGTAQLNKMEPGAQLAGSLLGKGTLGNQVVFGCSVPHSSTLIMRNGARQMVQSPNPLVAPESGFSTQLVNQAACIPMQQNPVHLVPQPSMSNAGHAGAGAASLPSALLLPNGQIIPVVSQPSLLYPTSAAVNGSLLMTSSSPTAVFQSPGGINTQQFKPIISKETLKATAVSHGTMRPPSAPISCPSSQKFDLQPKTSSTVMTNQSEACTSSTPIDASGQKKSVRKCHRAIKPKPTSPAIERAPEANTDSPLIIAANDACRSEESVVVKSHEATKSKSELAPPAKPPLAFSTASAAVASSSSAKSFDSTTDILAKATESIFANSVSEASPGTVLYGCETSFCNPGTEATNNICARNNAAAKSIEVLGSFDRDDSNESKDATEMPPNDIFTDLETVYETAEKDMPTLEPVSPLAKITAASSSTPTGDDTHNDKHAPQLSLMITHHPPASEMQLAPKRSEGPKSDLTPNKRQKLEAKLDTVACSKEHNSLPPTTQSLNFLSISQLTSSNFAMESNLSNDNSPLSSISPLLASPTKSLHSESFMSSSASQLATSAAPSLMMPPSVPQITSIPCSGSHEIHNIIGSCEGTMVKESIGRQENLAGVKVTSPASCSVKLPTKTSEHVRTSAPTTPLGIVSTSTFSPAHMSCTQSTASLADSPRATQHGGSIMQRSCSSLAHFPPTPSRNSNALQGIALLGALNTQNSLYGSVAPMASADATELTHSLSTSCASAFPIGVSSPSVETLTSLNIGNGASQQQNAPTSNNLNVANILQNHSFSMPDLIQASGVNKNHANFNNMGIHLPPAVGHEGQCAGESSEIANELINNNVPSFNFGLFNQQSAASQLTAQGTSRPFGQNFFQQQGGAVMMPPQANLGNGAVVGKAKNAPSQRNADAEAMLQPATVTPTHGPNIGHVGSLCQHANQSATTHAIAPHQTLSPEATLAFAMHRVSSATSNYSAESLISQVTYSAQKHLAPQATSRPCLSYSAESLIQSQADRTTQCIQNSLSHHPGGAIVNPSASSYANSANLMTVPYCTTSTVPTAAKRFNGNQQPCSVTNFHSPTSNTKTPCTHMHSHGNIPFSFSLTQTNNQSSNVQQSHLASAYPNVLPHYSSNFPARGNKANSSGQPPPFRQESHDGSGGPQVQNCSGYTTNSFSPFPASADRAASHSGSSVASSTALLSDSNKLNQEKNKSKQDNHIGKSNVKPKHSLQTKKKAYSVEEVNLSNSIFETNRSVTPYFTIPNLSPPRNEAPTYLAAPNLFSAPQRPPIGTSSSSQQGKTDLRTGYDPLFASRSQTGLNLNFQAPTFGVNHIHANTPAVGNPMGNHNNVTNFNLSNIFPDINATADNLPPMKFHSTNPVLPNDAQHQPNALYNRPMLPNGMSINGFLAHNPHNFDSRPPVTMPINNSVPPTFHGHSHTPSFGNVIPTLNFPMHDH